MLSKTIVTIIFFGLSFNLAAQTNNIAALDFDPKINGFGFKNYRNEGDIWKDDLGTDDVIRMFGVKTACKTGDSEKNCVLHPAAKQWIDEILEGMDIGHCEGIAVACLRINTDLPFKKKITPDNFQPGAKSPFSLPRNQLLQNYIAYYWITQTFEEIKMQTAETAESGPVNIAKTLMTSFKNKSDTYLISFFKYDKNNRKSDGHAVAPFKVEETADEYQAKHPPIVFITSNDEKDLPDAFLRRCLFHYVKFPTRERLVEILNARFLGTSPEVLEKAIACFLRLRQDMELDKGAAGKKVSTSELIDWFKALSHDTEEEVLTKLDGKLPYHHVLLKTVEDRDRYLGEG